MRQSRNSTMAEIVDFNQAQSFLNERFGDRAGDITRVSGGDWSQAYALSLDGSPVIVRFGRHGDDYQKDQIVTRWSSEVLPIPQVIELGEAPFGFFAVSQRSYGEFLDHLDDKSMTALLPNLFSVMDAIREIDVSDTHGYGLWTPDRQGLQPSWKEALLTKFGTDIPGSRTHGWRSALEASPRGAADFDSALRVLEELTDFMPSERHLIHGDLLYSNVLVQHERVSAVLDWGNSMYGDHLFDAAWLLYCQPRYTTWPYVDLRGQLQRHWEHAGPIPHDLELRLLCYQIRIGLDGQLYAAFKGNWDELELNRSQTRALVEDALTALGNGEPSV
jgi:hygromycin-B 4-O-kinase